MEQAFSIGKKYFIRTATHYQTGEVVDITDDGFLILTNCAWIADTGRFSDAVKSGNFKEVEPVQNFIVNKSAIIDAIEVEFELPNIQK